MDLPDDITLHVARRAADADLPLATLSEAECATLADFGSAKRQREYALGRTAARRLLAQRLGVPEAAVPLRVADDGAPEVEGVALHLSLAHVATARQTLAAAVAAPHHVGVDLERIRPRRPDLYTFLLDPEEYGLLDALPHPHDEAQILIWTLKEAVLKAMRTGFRLSPKKIRLTLGDVNGYAEAKLKDGTAWSLRYTRRDRCFLAVAFPRG